MNYKMNNKWKWVLGITKAMIVLLIPLLVMSLIFQDGGNGILGLQTLYPAWIIMIVWVMFVVFGVSEEG
jgi:hypothetical protein